MASWGGAAKMAATDWRRSNKELPLIPVGDLRLLPDEREEGGVPCSILSAQTVETIMDLATALKNIDAFMARLDNLENELAEKNAELEKVTQNRDSILKEKRALEGRQYESDFDRRLRESSLPSHIVQNEVQITREEARSGQAYREAKARAEKLGVPLRVVDEHAPAQQQGKRSSPVKYVRDADAGVLYVNADMISRHGQARCREIAAENGAKTMRAFRSVEDLPQPMQQAHAQAMADRSNLLGGE